MDTITTTQKFDFELSPRERKAISDLLKVMGTKAKFTVLKDAEVFVKIQVELAASTRTGSQFVNPDSGT